MAIIIGDIHGDLAKVKAFLAYKPEAEHVALGDYLDSFFESPENQIECIQILIDSYAVLLLGNHECHYLKNPLFRFAGFNLNWAERFQEILESNINRFLVAYAVDGWLLTHAGVNSIFTERESDVVVLANEFNSAWASYLVNRQVDLQAQYLYHSIFELNFRIWVEGNLLPTNIKQIFGHVENNSPIVETHFIALDTTNSSDVFWLYDTVESKLVELPLKTGR